MWTGACRIHFYHVECDKVMMCHCESWSKKHVVSSWSSAQLRVTHQTAAMLVELLGSLRHEALSHSSGVSHQACGFSNPFVDCFFIGHFLHENFLEHSTQFS